MPLTIEAGGSSQVSSWSFVGFFAPVDNAPVVNVAKAGSTVPLRWRLLTAAGEPVATLASASVTVEPRPCSVGTRRRLLLPIIGRPGLHNRGNGFYQFNWKTPVGLARSCKTMHLDLGEGVTHTAYVDFIR